MGAISRWLRSDLAGPLFIVVVGGGAIAVLRPSFPSPFNVEILLLAIATNALIALSRMVIIRIARRICGSTASAASPRSRSRA